MSEWISTNIPSLTSYIIFFSFVAIFALLWNNKEVRIIVIHYMKAHLTVVALSFLVVLFICFIVIAIPLSNTFQDKTFISSYIISGVGIFISLASLLNTVWLLRHSETRVNSYDELLIGAYKELILLGNESTKKNNQKSTSLSKESSSLMIFSPAPAIGNISAKYSLFKNYFELLNSPSIKRNITPYIITSADFSSWHKFYINQRVTVIKQLAFGGNGSFPSAAKAKSKLENEFPWDWHELLAFDDEYDMHYDNVEVIFENVEKSLKEKIDEYGNLYKKASRSSKVKDFEQAENFIKLRDGISERVDILAQFSHRASDMQALNILKGWRRPDNIFLLKSTSTSITQINFFPPCIALRILDSNFMCWMAPQRNNSVKNGLTGYFSKDTSSKNAIDNLFAHYFSGDSGVEVLTTGDFITGKKDDQGNIIIKPLQYLVSSSVGDLVTKYCPDYGVTQ